MDVHTGNPRSGSMPVLRSTAKACAGRPTGLNRRRNALLLAAVDAFSVVVSVGLGFLLVIATAPVGNRAWLALGLAGPLLFVSMRLHGLQRTNNHRLLPGGVAVTLNVIRSIPLAALAILGIVFGTGLVPPGRAFAVTTAVLLPAVLIVPAVRSMATHLGPRSWIARRQRVLIVGSGEAAESVADRLRRDGGCDVVGMVDDDPLPGFETIGTVLDIPVICAQDEIDRIIVALPRATWFKVSEVLQSLIGNIDIAIVPSLHELMTWRSGAQDLAGMPLIPLMAAQHGWPSRALKRAMDIVVGSIALVALSPIMAVAMIAIRIDSPGPVLFRQLRAGARNEPFKILKLRTMHVGAEAHRAALLPRSDADGPRFKMEHDPRVTRVGAVLRRFSIDELPQLFNVLSGTMSLVGPRPYPLVEAGAFQVGSAASRFDMLPGMTGLWQVSGRSDLNWDDLCRLDAIYVKSWSLAWDLRILLQTPAAALRAQGAY